MINISDEKIDEIAKNFYYIIYGHGPLVPRIGVKLRLQRMFGDKFFELEYMKKLGCKPIGELLTNRDMKPDSNGWSVDSVKWSKEYKLKNLIGEIKR